MTKKEQKVVKVSHVRELAESKPWDLPQFIREAQYQQGLAVNTVKKAWRGETNLSEEVVIKFARLFNCDKPYEQVLEVRLQ
jgi:hypothetical protein